MVAAKTMHYPFVDVSANIFTCRSVFARIRSTGVHPMIRQYYNDDTGSNNVVLRLFVYRTMCQTHTSWVITLNKTQMLINSKDIQSVPNRHWPYCLSVFCFIAVILHEIHINLNSISSASIVLWLLSTRMLFQLHPPLDILKRGE